MNSLVLSDAERASATDPVIRQLIEMIPRANFVDAAGTARFVGSRRPSVDTDRWTARFPPEPGPRNDHLHVFYGEPEGPGRWSRRRTATRFPASATSAVETWARFTVDETHTFGHSLLNEARFGRSPGRGAAIPGAELNPADFGIGNGVTRRSGCRRSSSPAASTSAGRPTIPTGRDDTSYVVSDTLSYFARPALRETRRRVSALSQRKLRARAPGCSTSPAWRRFCAGTANAFSITLGERRKSHRPARRRTVRPGQRHPPLQPRRRARAAVRVARHTDRAGRPVRGLRSGQRLAAAGRRGRRRDLPAEQPELRAAPGRGVESVSRRRYGRARRLCVGGRPAGHDRGQGHRRQSAVRDAAHGGRGRFPSATPS